MCFTDKHKFSQKMRNNTLIAITRSSLKDSFNEMIRRVKELL